MKPAAVRILCGTHPAEFRKEFAMIADHPVKVNGRWVMPGQEYGEPKKAETEPKPEVKAEEKAEPVAAETKPRTTRRKTAK